MPINLQRSPRRDFSLSTVLIVPFVFQVISVVGVVGYLSFLNGQKAVNNLAIQLRQELVTRIKSELGAYLQTPEYFNAINAIALREKQLDFSQNQGLPSLIQQLKVSPYIYGLYCGNNQGEMFGAFRTNNQQMGTSLASSSTNQELHLFDVTNQDQRGKFLRSGGKYDPRQRPWYKKTEQLTKQNWGDVYLDFDTQLPALTASQPVYNFQGSLLGVCGVDILLSEQFQKFLADLQIGKTGTAFIMTRSGELIASSNKTPIMTGSGKEAKLVRAEASQSLLIRRISSYLQSQTGGLKTIGQTQQTQYKLDGQQQLIAITPFTNSGGLDWLIVVVIPEIDFMEEINANTQTTILLCLLALAVAIALGIFTTRWIVGLILRLRDASQAIAQGNLQQTTEIQGVKELKDLAVAFNQMSGQLKIYFHDLESLVEGRTEELHQALQDLQKTQSQLIQSEKMSSLGQLVAGVAHEINNPVNFIHGNLRYAQDYTNQLLELVRIYQHQSSQNQSLDILQTGAIQEINQEINQDIDLAFIQEDLPKLFASMQNGTERIKGIVESLKTFSRLGESSIKTIDLNDGLDSTLVLLQHRLGQEENQGNIQTVVRGRSPIQIKKNYATLPPITCDAGQINQVFMNILTNSLDALEEYALESQEPDWIGEIQITTAHLETDYIQVTIADNAGGIPPEIAGRVFDPFFTTKPVGKGTGLGMAVSYQVIVQGHNGSLECCPVQPHGTEFVLTIPRRK